MEHRIRPATEAERRGDCCGDRYERNVAWVCSCGVRGCEACIKRHLFEAFQEWKGVSDGPTSSETAVPHGGESAG